MNINDETVHNKEIQMHANLNKVKDYCKNYYGHNVLEKVNTTIHHEKFGLMCPAIFDGITCWPDTLANHTITAPCSEHFIGFNKTQYATKFCTENGTWFSYTEYPNTWTNYTHCIINDTMTIEIPFFRYNTTIEKYLPIIKTISRTGYSISLFTLIIAFIVMFSIKKLHCPRNKLHMHLFASFIMRAFISLIKDLAFADGLPNDNNIANSTYNFFDGSNSECKIVTSLWEYFITANYSWILMEGLYLHNLIFRAMFAESNRKITHYIILGWGLPLMVIIPWIITRLTIENTLCWTTHDKHIFLIIRIPTMISILINLILFVRIAVVIFSKLKNPLYEEAKRYRKWARSTLVLAPLFGIHYAILLGMSYSINQNEIVELIWLIMDQTFASSQGFFVAVLYCFLNSEVRTELKPHFYEFLTCCATSNCLKYFFPCRDSYLRSAARCRTSVCTTMSCSSLYNNGFHRNSRSKDYVARSKQANVYIQDKAGDHICRPHVKSWHEGNQRRTSTTNSSGCSKSTFGYSSHGSTMNEKTSFIEKCKSESKISNETIPLNTIGVK